MRSIRALLGVAAAAVVAAPPAAATLTPSPGGMPWALSRLPLTTSYVWAQARLPAAPVPLPLFQPPVLRTYTWAQPDTAPVYVLHGQPWSL